MRSAIEIHIKPSRPMISNSPLFSALPKLLQERTDDQSLCGYNHIYWQVYVSKVAEVIPRSYHKINSHM